MLQKYLMSFIPSSVFLFTFVLTFYCEDFNCTNIATNRWLSLSTQRKNFPRGQENCFVVMPIKCETFQKDTFTRITRRLSISSIRMILRKKSGLAHSFNINIRNKSGIYQFRSSKNQSAFTANYCEHSASTEFASSRVFF